MTVHALLLVLVVALWSYTKQEEQQQLVLHPVELVAPLSQARSPQTTGPQTTIPDAPKSAQPSDRLSPKAARPKLSEPSRRKLLAPIYPTRDPKAIVRRAPAKPEAGTPPSEAGPDWSPPPNWREGRETKPGPVIEAMPVFAPPLELEVQATTLAARFRIRPDGSFEVELVRSTGRAELDDQALAGLRRWKWRPRKEGGEEVEASVVVDVDVRNSL